MNSNDLMELYNKERDYQTLVFGDYSKSPALNFASFITFLDQYVQKIKESYADKWDKRLPPWLLDTIEYEQGGSAPVESYEHLIKLMALAGAALEIYASIDVEKWRSEGVKEKWNN
jgi:hypothetical protein